MSTEVREALLRLHQVLEIIPVSRSTWYNGIEDGRFPKPIKFGKRIACWKKSEILALAENRAA